MYEALGDNVSSFMVLVVSAKDGTIPWPTERLEDLKRHIIGAARIISNQVKVTEPVRVDTKYTTYFVWETETGDLKIARQCFGFRS